MTAPVLPGPTGARRIVYLVGMVLGSMFWVIGIAALGIGRNLGFFLFMACGTAIQAVACWVGKPWWVRSMFR